MNFAVKVVELRAAARAISEFSEAFECFMQLHHVNEHLAIGLAPAVFKLDEVSESQVLDAAVAVDVAAGRAATATVLTNFAIEVRGVGRIDPIAAWRTISQPKPVLEPTDIRSACGQIAGRLDTLISNAIAEPSVKPDVNEFHPIVWAAAQPLWQNSHFKQAVAASAEALISHVKGVIGRSDIADTAVWQQAFSAENPAGGRPRLRWPGDPSDLTVKSMNDGLRQFAPGLQLTIRNTAVHGTEEMSEVGAAERLAALSLLARWVDQCELIRHPDDDPVGTEK